MFENTQDWAISIRASLGGRFNDQSQDVEVSNFEKLKVSLEKLFNSR